MAEIFEPIEKTPTKESPVIFACDSADYIDMDTATDPGLMHRRDKAMEVDTDKALEVDVDKAKEVDSDASTVDWTADPKSAVTHEVGDSDASMESLSPIKSRTGKKRPNLWTDETPMAEADADLWGSEIRTPIEAISASERATRINPVLSRVVPSDGDVYVFENVRAHTSSQIAHNDGLAWRDNGHRPIKLDKKVIGKKITYYAEVHKQLFTKDLRKTVTILNDSDRAVVTYKGDVRLAKPNNSYNYPEHLQPPKASKLPSIKSITNANQKQFDEYVEIHKKLSAKHDATKDKPSTEATTVDPTIEKTSEASFPPSKTASATTDVSETASPLKRHDSSSDSDVDSYLTSRRPKRRAIAGYIMDRDDTINTRPRDFKKLWEKNEGPWHDANRYMITDPKGGEVYYFDSSNLKTAWDKHILKDGVTWEYRHSEFIHNQDFFKRADAYREGKVMVPDFKRYSYFKTQSKEVVVHYVGDESVVRLLPHGNSTKKDGHFVSVSSEVRERIAKHGDGKKPKAIYDEETRVREEGLLGAVNTPRNIRQVQNYQHNLRARTWEERNDISNQVLAMNQYLPEVFVKNVNVTAYPVVQVATQKMLDEWNFVKSTLKELEDDTVPVIHYDTTYNMAGMNCSVLTMEHPFVTRPKNPEQSGVNTVVAAMFHERRPQGTHDHFIVNSSLHMKTNDQRTILVVDREFKEVPTMPNQSKALCWNHLKENAAYHAKTEGFTTKVQQKEVKASLHKLLMSQTPESFEKRLQSFKNGEGHPVWTRKNFQSYFDTSMKADLIKYASRWHLEEIGLKDTSRGITNNRAESVNHFLKSYTKEVAERLPEHIHRLYYAIDGLDREVEKAYYGEGDMQLKSQYEMLKRDPKKCPPYTRISYEESKEKFREFRAVKTPLNRPETPMKSGISEAQMSRANVICEQARQIYDAKDYSILHETNTIAVGDPGADRLARKQTVSIADRHCSCGEKPMCAHYLAALVATTARKDFFLEDKEMKALSKLEKKSVEKSGKKKYVGGRKCRTPRDLDDPLFAARSAKKSKGEMTEILLKSPEPETATFKSPGLLALKSPEPAVLKSALKTPRDKTIADKGMTPSAIKRALFVDADPAVLKTDALTTLEKDLEDTTTTTTAEGFEIYGDITIDSETTMAAIREREFFGRIKKQESRVITEDGEVVSVIKNVGDGKMLITKVEGYKHDDKLKIMAAELSDTVAYQHPNQQVFAQTVTVPKDKFFGHAKKLIDDTKTALKGRAAAIPVSCSCCQPKVPSDHLKPFDTHCTDCGEGYHKSCAKGYKELAWQCPPCNTGNIVKGVQWAEGVGRERITNTCTIDNFLTGAAIHSKTNKVDFNKIINKNEGEKAMAKAIQHAINGESNKAQTTYYKYLEGKNSALTTNKKFAKSYKMNEKTKVENEKIEKENKNREKKGLAPLKLRELEKVPPLPVKFDAENDLYGSPEEFISSQLKEASTWEYEITCTNSNCEKHKKPTTTEVQTVYVYDYDEKKNMAQNVEKTLTETTTPCGTCNAGREKKSDIKPKDTTWFVDINLALTKQEEKDLKQKKLDLETLPRSIHASGKDFALSHVTTNKDGNHFVSLMYDKRNDDFSFYDGMLKGNKNSHFRKVLPQDMLKDQLCHATYFLKK